MKNIKQLSNKNLTSLIYSSVKTSDEKTVSLCEEEFENRYLFNQFVKLEKIEDEWRKDRKSLLTSISEFKKELDNEFIRNRRIEFLETECINIYKKYEDTGNKMVEFMNFIGEVMPGFDKIIRSIFKQELDSLLSKYKILFVELGSLKGNLPMPDYSNSEETLIQCRAVPVETFIRENFVNAGNGRKKCKCPFHNEKTASFLIFPDNAWHCFGCGKHGNNAVDFVMAEHNYTFVEALKYLKEMI